MKKILRLMALLLVVPISFALAQVEGDDDDDEDWDAYGEVEYSGGATKSFANAKILGLSPARFITIGYEQQMPYNYKFSAIDKKVFPFDESRSDALAGDGTAESGRILYTGGLRINANIPVISTNKIIWQMGFNYMQSYYRFEDESQLQGGLAEQLDGRSLHTTGLFTTIYKPLNETTFLLFQGAADMSGDYTFANLGEQNPRYSAAALWGKRPHDRLQWAVGMSRTYRVGAPNYFPVVMYNYTSSNRKWGIEALLPARALYRYNLSQTKLILAGLELEGGSYRIAKLSDLNDQLSSFEIRRGEIKTRVEFQKQLSGFFWWSAQAGVRLAYSFDADYLDNDSETFRVFGLLGDDPFSMRGALTPAPYFNLSISFVSP